MSNTKKRDDLSVKRAKELLKYDPETGELTWRESRGRVRSGDVAGGSDGRLGYISVGIDGVIYRAHRVIWLLVNGRWPKEEIDHIDRCPWNNRLSNLREATPSQNQQNKNIRADNTSGYKGVTWHRRCARWQAQISVGGKNKYLGFFETTEEAYAAYQAAASRYHDFNTAALGELQP